MIRVIIENKQYELIEKNDLDKLFKLLKEKPEIKEDLFDRFVEELK